MTAFPTTGLAVRIDVETLPLWKDTARTQPATANGDAILAMGDAGGLGPRGETLTPGAGLTLGMIGTKKALKLPGTAAVGVDIVPNGGLAQFNGDYLPVTFLFSFLYPAEAAGAIRYLQRMYNTGGNWLYNVYYPDARLGVAKRVASSAQVFSQIEAVGTKNQRCVLAVRYSGSGPNMALDVWLDRGDGSGAVKVINAAAVAGQTITVNTLRMGDNFNGLMREYAAYSVALSDADVADTMAAMATNTPIVAATPAVTLNNDSNLRAFSARQGPITLSGSFANISGTVASISTRVIRVSDGAVVRNLAASGATISGTNFSGLSFANGPATPQNDTYQREFVFLDAGGAALATVRPATTFVVGWVAAFGGSSTAERASYEYTGPADPNLWAFTPEVYPNLWRTNDTAGRGIHSYAIERRKTVNEQIIVTNYGKGSTTLHYHAYSSSEGPPGTALNGNLNPFQVWINGYAQCQAIPDELVLTAGANDSFKTYTAGSEKVRSRQNHAVKWDVWVGKIRSLFGITGTLPLVTLPPNNRVNDLGSSDAPIGSDGSTRATMARGGELTYLLSLPQAAMATTMDLPVSTGDIHFTSGSNDIAFTRAAAAHALKKATPAARYCAVITTAEFVTDGAILNIQHAQGAALAAQPTNGWEGFRVYDNTGARVTITGPITTVSATKVKVPFARDTAKAYTIAHQDGTTTADTQAAAIASLPNLLKDDIGLPVLMTITAVGEIMLGDGTRVTVTNV